MQLFILSPRVYSCNQEKGKKKKKKKKRFDFIRNEAHEWKRHYSRDLWIILSILLCGKAYNMCI